jgi:O-Antigen ligase
MASPGRTVASLDGHPELAAAGPKTPAPLPFHGLVLVAALATAILGQGAYYATGQRVVGVLVVVAAIAAVRAQAWTRRDASLSVVAACVALAIWAVLSAALAGSVAGARSMVALLLGVAAVIMVCRRTTAAQRDALVGAVVAIGALSAGTGWVGVAWRYTPWALQDQGLWRAATTLTYANAAGGLLVPLTLLALAQRAVRPRSPSLTIASCLMLVGVGATLSRGGALALTIGIAVLALLLGPVRVVRAAGPPALGAVIALLGLAPSMPASGAPRPLLAAGALLVGLVVAAVLPLLGRRTATALLLLCLVLIAGLIPRFLSGGPALSAITSSRLSFSSSDRVQGARAALRLAERRPLTGAGPGRAALFWADADGRTLTVRYVHNEYLQVLAELGAVGLALLLAFLVVVARMAWRGREAVGSPASWAGVVAALVALAVHSGLDFLWHLPAIPLTGALLIGLTTPPVEEGRASTQAASPTAKEESAQGSLASHEEEQ